MSYATTIELAAYLGIPVNNLPANAATILNNASDIIDWVTLGRIDTEDVDQAAAASKATCQQYEYWASIGEDQDISGITYRNISIGTFSAQFTDNGNKQPQVLSPRARRTLSLAGLLYRGVRMI